MRPVEAWVGVGMEALPDEAWVDVGMEPLPKRPRCSV